MSSPAKITFGKNATTSYSSNSGANFAYRSGDNITSSYSPYNPVSTGLNPITTASYSTYEAPRQTTYANYQTQPYSTNFTSGQLASPVGLSYESNKNVTYASPAAKVTFGSKQYAPVYTPPVHYETNYAYTNPSPVQYQTYQTYQQPVQITTQPIQHQVLREEVRVQQPKVEPAVEVRKSNVVAPQPETIKETKSKTKKGGCPSWLWPLLGILALLALILGLLFGLGVFGKIGGAGATTGSVTTGTTGTTGATTGATTGTTGVTTGTGASTGTTETGAAVTGPTTGYTVIEETVILSKDNPVTTPTLPTPTIPTLNITTPTTPTTPTTSSDDFIDPTIVTPIPVASTTSTTTSYPTTTTTNSYATGYSSDWSNPSSTTNWSNSGTTYPTNSYDTTYPTNSYGTTYPTNPTTSVDSVNYDYVQPTSAF